MIQNPTKVVLLKLKDDESFQSVTKNQIHPEREEDLMVVKKKIDDVNNDVSTKTPDVNNDPSNTAAPTTPTKTVSHSSRSRCRFRNTKVNIG